MTVNPIQNFFKSPKERNEIKF